MILPIRMIVLRLMLRSLVRHSNIDFSGVGQSRCGVATNAVTIRSISNMLRGARIDHQQVRPNARGSHRSISPRLLAAAARTPRCRLARQSAAASLVGQQLRPVFADSPLARQIASTAPSASVRRAICSTAMPRCSSTRTRPVGVETSYPAAANTSCTPAAAADLRAAHQADIVFFQQIPRRRRNHRARRTRSVACTPFNRSFNVAALTTLLVQVTQLAARCRSTAAMRTISTNRRGSTQPGKHFADDALDLIFRLRHHIVRYLT